mmetsp:Transcript_2551/g.7548  ORF Transcript_2551/g.7548 Transcript_2551/m.7548 type:complete len:362 (-) Transcript_2551:102-1187(-)
MLQRQDLDRATRVPRRVTLHVRLVVERHILALHTAQQQPSRVLLGAQEVAVQHQVRAPVHRAAVGVHRRNLRTLVVVHALRAVLHHAHLDRRLPRRPRRRDALELVVARVLHVRARHAADRHHRLHELGAQVGAVDGHLVAAVDGAARRVHFGDRRVHIRERGPARRARARLPDLEHHAQVRTLARRRQALERRRVHPRRTQARHAPDLQRQRRVLRPEPTTCHRHQRAPSQTTNVGRDGEDLRVLVREARKVGAARQTSDRRNHAQVGPHSGRHHAVQLRLTDPRRLQTRLAADLNLLAHVRHAKVAPEHGRDDLAAVDRRDVRPHLVHLRRLLRSGLDVERHGLLVIHLLDVDRSRQLV